MSVYLGVIDGQAVAHINKPNATALEAVCGATLPATRVALLYRIANGWNVCPACTHEENK